MALPQGIYFRATDNQTDPTNYDCEVGTAFATGDYPWTTAQGNTVGWEQGINDNRRDRNTATDVRLMGVNFVLNSATACDFRIDLPAGGSYNIRLAAGDKTFGSNNRVQFLDTTTQLADLSLVTSAGHWMDATGIDRNGETAWANNNAASAQTFATTIFRARVGLHSSGTSGSNIAALYIESAGGGGTVVVPWPLLMGMI